MSCKSVAGKAQTADGELSIKAGGDNREERKFTCRRCGNCCRWPGYVRLSVGEVEQIAAFLALDVRDFTARYTELTRDRRNLSLREKDSGACIFLDDSTEPAKCLIEAVKPRQCRRFPLSWNFPGWEKECSGQFD